MSPEQVRAFVERVRRKVKASKTQPAILDSVVEFPKSASPGTEEEAGTSSRAGEDRSNPTHQALPDVTLSDKVKADIEAVVDESHTNLIELHCMLKNLEAATDKYRWKKIDDEGLEAAVMKFKSEHQKNALNGRHLEGKIDVIGICFPFEDKNNRELEELVKEKHQTLVTAYYQEVLYAKVILCQGLDWQKEEDVRAREKKALELVNNVLGIDYNGQPDPVDFAHSVKSILEYVLGVVPKHLGKEPAEEDDEQAAGSSSGPQRRRPSLVESPEWESSWQKHFEDAEEDRLTQEAVEAANIRLEKLKREKQELDDMLEKLIQLQEDDSDSDDLEDQDSDNRKDQGSDSDTEKTAKKRRHEDTEESPKKRQRGSSYNKKTQKKK